MKFLKSIFSKGDGKKPEPEEAIEYAGFKIQPTPKNVSNGWTTEAMITKGEGDSIRSHHFIRADVTGSKEGAKELTIAKAKIMIDQVGDKVFSR